MSCALKTSCGDAEKDVLNLLVCAVVRGCLIVKVEWDAVVNCHTVGSIERECGGGVGLVVRGCLLVNGRIDPL